VARKRKSRELRKSKEEDKSLTALTWSLEEAPIVQREYLHAPHYYTRTLISVAHVATLSRKVRTGPYPEQSDVQRGLRGEVRARNAWKTRPTSNGSSSQLSDNIVIRIWYGIIADNRPGMIYSGPSSTVRVVLLHTWLNPGLHSHWMWFIAMDAIICTWLS
jgi:hypothetical protein